MSNKAKQIKYLHGQKGRSPVKWRMLHCPGHHEGTTKTVSSFSVSSTKVTKGACFLPDNVHFQVAVEADMAPHQAQEGWQIFGGIFLCQCLTHFPFTPAIL